MSRLVYPDKRVERTRKRLENALLTSLKSLEFKDITVSELTKVAKVNRTTFYNHYDSIDQLFERIVERVIDDLIRAYREPYKGKRTFVMEELQPDTITVFNAVYQHRDVYRTIVQSPLLPFFQYSLTQAITNVALKDYKNQLVKVDNQLHAVFYAHAITGLIIHWVTHNFEHSPTELANQLIHIIKYTPAQTYVVDNV